MNIIVIVLISFILSNNTFNNSKDKSEVKTPVVETIKTVVKEEVTEPVIEVAKEEATEPEENFFSSFLPYIIGLILLVGISSYIYLRKQKNKLLSNYPNDPSDDSAASINEMDNQTDNTTEQIQEEQPVVEENSEQIQEEHPAVEENSEQIQEEHPAVEENSEQTEPKPSEETEEDIKKDDDHK